MNYDLLVSWDANLIDVWYTDIDNPNAKGLVRSGIYIASGAPATNAGYYMPGAMIQNVIDKTWYIMNGTTAAPTWALIESSASNLATFVYNTDSTAGALTIPAAKFVNAILDRNGGTADRTDVTDTAAAIVAAIPGAIVGSTFEFVYRNRSATTGQKLTLTAGVGVTVSGNASNFANGDITYIGIVTNVGTPAVTIYAEAASGALQPTVDATNSVNTVQVTTSATNTPVAEAAVGSDSNISMSIDGKGTGGLLLGGISTGKNSLGRGSVQPPLLAATIGALGTTQNSTPSAAQLLGGIVTQTGATGAGTVQLPTGTLIANAVITALGIVGAAVSVGDMFECLFANLGGGQTLTITSGVGSTVVGNGAVPTAKTARLLFVNTGANTWNIYSTVSA